MLLGPNLCMDNGSQWIIRIRNILQDDEELDGDGCDVPAAIAGVPKPLISSKPEAYIPQLIALGPYHHCREELHHMERYKLSAAKRIRTRLPDMEFQQIVDLFHKHEYRIRAHYQRYLPFNSETLAWMMAIDSSFLLEFLQTFSVNIPETLPRIPSRHGWPVHSTRRTSTHDMLVQDVLMLENQLPLFLLLKILQLQATNHQVAKEALTAMLVAFLKEITPFKKSATFHSAELSSHSHLLELLYHSITPPLSTSHDESTLADHPKEAVDPRRCCNLTKQFANSAKRFTLARVKSLTSLLVKCLIKIPWTVISSVPTFAALKVPVENIFNVDAELAPVADQGLSFEEIAIPSVTELANVGIKFVPTDGDVASVAFDAKTSTLHLPQISLDVNSRVLLRNLVAYEAAVVTGPLMFTRYVELMNGIIDTADDARLLRESGVLVNLLRSDGEVAEMWNGMSRSVRLTRARALDEVIEEVNTYYDGVWRVKAGRFVNKYVKRHVVSSSESLVVLVVTLLVMILGLQALSTGFGLKFGALAH